MFNFIKICASLPSFSAFHLIKENLFQDKTIINFDKNGRYRYILLKLHIETKDITTFEQISWFDILKRRIRFVCLPPKGITRNTSDIWKRRSLKWLHLWDRNFQEKINILWLSSILYLDMDRKFF